MAPKAKEAPKKDAAPAKKEAPKETAKEAELRAREAKLVKPPEPNREALDASVNKLTAEISELSKKVQDIRDQVDSKGDSNFRNEHERLKVELQKAKEECDKWEQKFDGIKKTIGDKLAEGRQMRGELKTMRKRLPYETPAAIDGRIAELEYQMQTATLDLKQERAILKEITELKGQKPGLGKLAQMESAAGVFDSDNVGPLQAQQTEVREAMQRARAYRGTVSAQLKKLFDERRESTAGFAELFDQRKALQAQVKEKIDERNKLRDEFRAAGDKWYAYQKELRQIRWERNSEERERRKAEWVERSAAREAMREELPPMLDELLLVDQTEAYVKSLQPKNEDDGQTEAKTEVKHDAPKGAVVLESKDSREAGYYFAPTKGKKDKKDKKKESKKLAHNLGALKLFDELKVTPPLTTEDLEKTLSQLSAKRKEFEDRRDKQLEEREKKKAEREAAVAAGGDAAAAEE